MLSEETIEKLIEQLKSEQYQPKPIKQISISENKDKSAFEIPSMNDIIVQKIIEMILSSIYESLFKDESYRFRNDALLSVENNFYNVNWFISGEITALFENINRNVLVNLLRKKIKDERFIRLICKFLKAGYLENWIYSSMQQSGNIRSILSNIYMNELDKYMESLVCGSKLMYVRCADKFLVGVAGSKEYCCQIKDEMTKFLYDTLSINLSQEKTVIVHSSKNVSFLGCEITSVKQSARKHIKLQMPKTVITKKLTELNVIRDLNETPWRGKAKAMLLNKSDLEIVQFYNKEIIKLYNNYRLANNVNTEMKKFCQVIKWSVAHTLANKHKCHIKEVLKKYHYNGYGDDKDKTIRVLYKTKKGEDKVCKLYNGGFAKKSDL